MLFKFNFHIINLNIQCLHLLAKLCILALKLINNRVTIL